METENGLVDIELNIEDILKEMLKRDAEQCDAFITYLKKEYGSNIIIM